MIALIIMLNIGLDLDGVICEWRNIPEDNRTWETYDKTGIMAGAANGLSSLYGTHYLSIITARHYPSARWHVEKIVNALDPQRLYIGEYVVGIPTSSKWRVLQALNADVHVDDNPRAFHRLPLNIVPILFRGPQNEDIPWEGTEVHSWPELVEAIKILKERKDKL